MASSREELKNRVMRRVYVVHAVRWILRPQRARLGVLVLSVWSLFAFVSITNVITNAPSSLAGQFNFILAAILNTEFVVQLALAAALVVAALFVRDVFRLSRLPHFSTF